MAKNQDGQPNPKPKPKGKGKTIKHPAAKQDIGPLDDGQLVVRVKWLKVCSFDDALRMRTKEALEIAWKLAQMVPVVDVPESKKTEAVVGKETLNDYSLNKMVYWLKHHKLQDPGITNQGAKEIAWKLAKVVDLK